jgi:1-acyl-sn-glycerol-3-phosphate acyltransferase
MLQPTPEELKPLSRIERWSYYITDFFFRYFKWILRYWNKYGTISFVNLSTARRIRVDGLKVLQQFNKDDSVILVSNHRSFFDFYVISWITYRKTNMGNRSLFPVRSTFFYEGFLGLFVNFFAAGFAMFPPIMRSRDKKAFNQFALRRVNEELTIPGTVVGMHPEGTRKKEGDAYTFLKPRPGIGQLALNNPQIKVIPIFINGLSNKIGHEMKLNYFNVVGNEIDIVIGEAIDFSHLQTNEYTKEIYIEATELCMQHIQNLSEKQREIDKIRKVSSQEV